MKQNQTAIFSLLLIILVSAFTYSFLSGGTERQQQTIDVRIEPGMTMSALYERYADESVDKIKFIDEIAYLNEIDGYQLRAGETIRIPVVKSSRLVAESAE